MPFVSADNPIQRIVREQYKMLQDNIPGFDPQADSRIRTFLEAITIPICNELADNCGIEFPELPDPILPPVPGD